jgi:hypothetical protein
MSPDARNMKKGPDTLSTVETSTGAPTMKTGPEALSTTENDFGSAKI